VDRGPWAVGRGLGAGGWGLERAGRGAPAPYNLVVRFEGLPGADWVDRGLEDLAGGIDSVPALLVSIGAPRLHYLGIAVAHPFDTPEHRLYARLAEDGPDAAHSRYNALIRRLVSFERALACAR
jgi:hypothetical protein